MTKADCDSRYYEANKARIKERANAYYYANKEAQLAKQRGKYAENRERTAVRNRAWATKNKDKMRAYQREYVARNRDKWTAQTAEYRAKKREALAPWADTKAIRAVYAEARKLRDAGGDWQVDHIIPLKSDIVCGLHVANNLEIIVGLTNRQKSNKHWPDMP